MKRPMQILRIDMQAVIHTVQCINHRQVADLSTLFTTKHSDSNPLAAKKIQHVDSATSLFVAESVLAHSECFNKCINFSLRRKILTKLAQNGKCIINKDNLT
jgi:hypothetical protein